MKELIDDEAFKPEKLFDKENYNTLTVALNNGAVQYKEKDIDVLLSLLDPNITREDKDEALSFIKENKLQQLLMRAVIEAENEEDRAKLLCICWESGLDFTNHFLFFVEQACNADYMAAFEAYTVVENTEDVTNEEILTKALLIVNECKKGQQQILSDLKTNILSRKT